MKHFKYPLTIIGALLAIKLLTGCAANGEFDAAAFNQGVGAVRGVMSAYDQYENPAAYRPVRQ